jgi:hypothetical protein
MKRTILQLCLSFLQQINSSECRILHSVILPLAYSVTQTQIHKHTHTVAVMKSGSNFALQEKSKFITNLQAFVLGY